MKRARQKHLTWTALSLAALAGFTWYSVRQDDASTKVELPGIPAPPDVSRWPKAFQAAIERAMAELQAETDPSGALRRLARLYYANGFDREAEQALRAVVARDPDDSKSVYLLATLLARRNDPAEAETLFAQVRTASPDYTPALLQFGQLLGSSGRHEEARQCYLQRRQAEPADVLATLGLADIERRAGRTDAAIEHLEALLRLRPTAAEPRLLLAEVLDSAGRTTEATEQRRKAEQTGVATPSDDPWLEEVYLEGFDPFRLQTLGMVRLNAGAAEAAVPFLRRAAELAPGDGDIQDGLALALQKIGRRDEAIAVLELALAQTAAPVVRLRLADLLASQSQFAEAEAHLRQAQLQYPDRADVHDGLGRLYNRQGRFGDAIGEFEEALRINPVLADTQLNLGRAYLGAKRWDAARDAITRALDMRPEWPEALLLLGELALSAGQWDEASALAERVWSAASVLAATQDFYARVQLRLAAQALEIGATEEAERIYQQGLERLPTHGPLWGALGALQGRQGRLAEAQVTFARYVEVAPQDARAWFLFGTTLEQLGRRAEALEAFQRGAEVAAANGDQQRAALIDAALQRLRR